MKNVCALQLSFLLYEMYPVTKTSQSEICIERCVEMCERNVIIYSDIFFTLQLDKEKYYS